MGSTFKVFTMAAAFENSKINLTSNFDASKPLSFVEIFNKRLSS